jgi:hypothetical protein
VSKKGCWIRRSAALYNELRTGGPPLRVVLHKTSYFDPAEQAGFAAALRDTPIVSLVTLVPSLFRLLRYGAYPPKVGTVCTVNGERSFLFTSGFVPELGTYWPEADR